MYELPSLEGVDEILVNQDTVEHKSAPIKIYAQKALETKARS
jgi:ATP-dependent protease Clp ATPase subunit